MGQLRDRMEEDLKLGGYSVSTSRIYLHYARQFAAYHKRSPAEMGEPEIRAYLLHLMEAKCSHETYRQVRAGLHFLYTVTLRRPVEIIPPPMRRKPTHLPQVLSGSEVSALLEAVRNSKYRAVLMVMYGAGLRVAEACQLRPEDIDSKRMLIRVRDGKGNRDRYTLLSARLLDFLRQYWRHNRPQTWLFPGLKGRALSPNTVRHTFQKACRLARISKRVTPHVLRHSFATHLLESGTDISVIQVLLGHASLQATTVYTHITLEHLSRLRSPLDLLHTPDGAVLG